MQDKLISLKKEISKHLENSLFDDPISFSTENPMITHSNDSDVFIYLLFDKEPLAKIGVSYGLKDYYHLDDYGGIDVYSSSDPLISKAVERAENKWGVTLMQSFPGKRSLRENFSKRGFNYKKILMEKMTELSNKFDFPMRFYLPGNLVFWNLNLIDCPFSSMYVNPNVLDENYDHVAKKFGFHLSLDESLYER